MTAITGLKRVDEFLKQMIEEQQIPGAVYAVVNEHEVLAENAIGYSHLKEKIPMTLETLFDLASLTKICATLPSLLLLIEQGFIEIDDPIQRYFPEGQSHVTVRHLLTHTSGFTATVPFYKYGWTKNQILDYILSEQPIPDQKVVYSDLNFILLGFLIEKITEQSLDVFTQKNIYQPLGMVHTTFNPQTDLTTIAPTEWRPEKSNYQWGEVHDENAYHLKGVAGHAGLFSNLHDLKIYVQMLIRSGTYGDGKPFLSPRTLKVSQRNYTQSLNLNRGLGWQLGDDTYSPAGYFLSKNSYGHTGFTGTSLWIDPEKNIGLILLANRVHISREINMNRMRRVFHNIVSAAFY
ncbi:CubicO group peptidase (beta-lactamase class C family) [Pullulanibacillus pueri]|uniref:Serine hydrolase n=1 Tax=Pullulanibacillus pueri TaxID=1437324 RepID=A0A8J2ZT26_9BACL|nr:serine hydrolase domain-containing protein [Pullulanibacillus pueri]MBM7681843.1 CubicO group peptidase (beta-lactamase class C family) [Pullulanibacillus pueri]GGH76308.1 serine hydrolase [Pullulanibacillus pueri]